MNKGRVPNANKDLRGTWPRALASLLGAIAMILTIRWACFEPYVIPSGSMIPTLLIHDHILVNKFSYGVHLPFATSWLVRFAPPRRGDVIVFRSVDDSGVFLIKRVIGLPGDEIRISVDGLISINGQPVPRRMLSEGEILEYLKDRPNGEREEMLERFDFYLEKLDDREHVEIRSRLSPGRAQGPYKVPAGSLFMMGDNRDNSSDSRVWGTLPIDRVLGRASLIWLSCDETLENLHEMRQLCHPQKLRWPRMGKSIQ